MFLPLDRKPDWRHPPLVTLLLILANLVVFFIWQINDDQYEHEAVSYYFSSDLPEIELTAYRKYLKDPANPSAFRATNRLVITGEQEMQQQLLSMLVVDGPFLESLEAGQIIEPGSPEFSSWQSQRAEFEQLLKRSMNFRFSQINIHPSLVTLFSALFLHADLGHLIANMFFLFLFGFVVEIILGHVLYLFAYLFCGIMSGLFYLMLEPQSAFLAMGASGAISGLAGMYTVLFGLRKIRFFYTLLFYFDYVRAPAIILLPLWLGYELVNQFLTHDNVNYLAHIGGLLSGALIAWLAKRYLHLSNTDYLDAGEKDREYKVKYQQATQALAKLDVEKSKQLFSELAEDYPNNIDILVQYYNVAKFNPGSENIHTAASAVFNLPGSDKQTVKILHDIFIDYVEMVQPNIRLKPDQMMSLALRFAAHNYLEDAEKIILHLTTRATEYARNPEGLMALATHYRRANNQTKAEKFLSLLIQCYPESLEAQHARQASEHA